ncbi:hypothetical protein CKA32_003781 [Geitlerinema sp. FC II]|nr:hypothetical protein CKA32_003781 [Geitlerinema sp. FC II]
MTDRSVSRSTPYFSSHAPYVCLPLVSGSLFPVPRSPFPFPQLPQLLLL